MVGTLSFLYHIFLSTALFSLGSQVRSVDTINDPTSLMTNKEFVLEQCLIHWIISSMMVAAGSSKYVYFE